MPSRTPSPTPTSLERVDESRFRIGWSDDTTREYKATELQDKCPCATCREKRSGQEGHTNDPLQLNVLSPQETAAIANGGVKILGMRPVGSYAYHIDFSDGCNTGIYTLEFLKELGVEV